MEAFKAYDIRGIYNQDFDREDVYKIGYFLPGLLGASKVLVGYDARPSSGEIFEALTRGINDYGADVYSIGLATTPMVYFATAEYGFSASVQITASHNSSEYNGLKISREQALPVGYESGLARLEEMVDKEEIRVADSRGEVYTKNARSDYIDFLKNYTPRLYDLSIGIDCSNCMAGLIIEDILGSTPDYIYVEPDGRFPNHEPNPLLEENIRDLQQLVKEGDKDLGIIFDGDGDRVMFVDEKGRFISPDLMIAVIADYFFRQPENRGSMVLHDIRTSRSVVEYIEELGGKTYMWKVGHAYAKDKLREIDGLFGGELAGHYYFRDFYYCDSGILAALLVLNVMTDLKQKGRTISQLIEGIDNYVSSGEINYQLEEKKEAMEELKNYFAGSESLQALHDFDGYRLEFPEWWFNVRPSNTEPYLRLVVEAESKKLLNKRLEEINCILDSYQNN
ncbi:MAG: phosphomannomutase/phosphoglucomutase [Bacillota bacterium]